MSLLNRFPWMLLLLALAVAYPIYPPVNDFVFSKIGQPVGNQLPTLFIFAILALGLNVVIGYAGLLHLGIGAFFGVGAYLTGILTVADYPFQLSFPLAVLISILGAAALSVMLSAPVLRLRRLSGPGDTGFRGSFAIYSAKSRTDYQWNQRY